ncbi:MAG: M3 family metallopeptidase [Cyanobacteria bacterium]|nr:M3 family metallopeptidase [Cyanobacteriota bacterium]MDA1020759.1 M3 family metallopeptidase [Cyanobacteriota bacterium]
MTNPLLDYGEFAPYAEIQAKDIVPAIKVAIDKSQAQLEAILELPVSEYNFANTIHALVEMENHIGNVWTPVENLLSLMGKDDIRDAANEARPLVVEFYNNYSLDPRVYKLIKDYSQTTEAKSLTGEKKRHLENTILDFKLSGAELEGKEKEEFKTLNLKLSDLSQKFSDNVTDSKFELIVTDKSDLAGLPEDIIDGAKRKADEMREHAASIPVGAWLFNLDYPSYGPFMKFADNGNLRKQLYIQYLAKATDSASRGLSGGDKAGSLNNEPLINAIYAAKLRKTNLLGYKNYAELSLQTKMAPSPEKVKEFLQRLGIKAKPLAQKEYQALIEFQKQIGYQNTENNLNDVYPWDRDYLSEKLRKAKYDFDTNLTKPYFELRNTIKGMFEIAETIYSIKLERINTVSTWHEDVEVYQVQNKDGSIVGTFYMDLYPRDIKRQGAWVMPLVGACIESDGTKILPQCTLVCNLTKPTDTHPSLLTHIEVVTLFHEFGHALHHLFSKVELEPLSGTNVEWDFVELPSQLNENFSWEKESLLTFAKHYQTGEVIPDELLGKMLAARTFNEGLACIRQLEFSLFDFAIHMRESAEDSRSPNDIFKEIVAQNGVFSVWEGTNFPCSFSHIFAGGYSAGYYSYKWAEVLEADAFSRFQKEGVLNPKLGQEYKEKILERGDAEPPMDLFKDFMGREPSEDALLSRMGLETAPKSPTAALRSS